MKIGFILTDKKTIAAWENEMLQHVKSLLPEARIIFLKITDISILANKTKRSVLYRLFNKFEEYWFTTLPNAFERVLIDSYTIIEITTQQIKDEKFDILYTSPSVVINDELAAEIKYGVWSIYWSNNFFIPGFDEVMTNNPVIKSSLQIKLKGQDEKVIIYDGITNTIPFSVKNTLITLAWRSSSYLAYRLNELVILGSEHFLKKYETKKSKDVNKYLSDFSTPGNFKMIFLFSRNLIRYLLYKLKSKLKKKRFTILFSLKNQNILQPDLRNFKSLPLPSNTFWADPFVIKHKEDYFIFFEDFSYEKNKGSISVITINSNGSYSDANSILDRPYHLSYPFVFKWEDEFYMIPETGSEKKVELYKSAGFPYQWGFVMNLMENIILIDATLVYHNNKWWLFGITQAHPDISPNDQLMLFYSNDLFSGKWTTHPQNPIVTDISNCRPAGKIFKIQETLYRPAQNNASFQYGYGIKLNKIITLTEKDYLEELVYDISPDTSSIFSAIHTINSDDGITVIDGIVN